MRVREENDAVEELSPPGQEIHFADRLASHESPDSRIEAIAKYLSVDNTHDEILFSLNDTLSEGSCGWLSEKHTFTEWMRAETPRFFWLKGPPGCGKSILASHVINVLREYTTCHYFFRAGENVSSNLSSFLGTMAFQMARANPPIAESIWKLARQGPSIDTRNAKYMWRNIFTGCIFQKALTQPLVSLPLHHDT